MSKESSNTQKKRGGGFGPGGGPGGMMPGEKPKDFKGSFKKLASYLAEYKVYMIFVVIFAIASTIFTIVGPNILGDATTEIGEGLMESIMGTGNGIDFGIIGSIIIKLIILYGLSAVFSYIQGHLMAHVTTKVSYNLRDAIMTKINRLPMSFFNKTNHGEVLSRITNDVDTLSQSLNQSITQAITSVVSITGVLVMMFSISWKMTLIALAMIPVSMILVMFVVKISQKYFVGQQKYLGVINGHIEEMYGGHTVVKAFNGEEGSLKKFDEENEKIYESAWKSQFYSGVMMPIMIFVGNLGYVVICIVGASMVAAGTLKIGKIQSFIQYVRSFTQPITQLANISNMVQQTMASSERIFEFLGEEEEDLSPGKFLAEASVSGSSTDSASVDNSNLEIKGNVRFENVKFGYDPEKIIINDFSAVVSEGQKVAIVGPTGAGKTTMVKLLMRFYELNGGAIYIDGADIRSIEKEKLRDAFGMVLQDTWLYNGSIMDNIRYGKLTATDEEVIRAAKAAQVDHFVRTLPDSYNMILNEESTNVSQGQKQLLTIARAILADSKVLILDEATSSVDTRTEILIQKAMDNLLKGRTSFIIAHRLSTIRNADMILCMKDGDIVEQGTHDELMATDGFYANLYNSQFEKISDSGAA